MTAVNAMIWLVIMVVMNILETSLYFKKTFDIHISLLENYKKASIQMQKEQHQYNVLCIFYLHQDPSSVLPKFDILLEIWGSQNSRS